MKKLITADYSPADFISGKQSAYQTARTQLQQEFLAADRGARTQEQVDRVTSDFIQSLPNYLNLGGLEKVPAQNSPGCLETSTTLIFE